MYSIWLFQIYLKTKAILIPFLRLEKEMKSYQNLDFSLASFSFEYPKEEDFRFVSVCICVVSQEVLSSTRYNELNFLDVYYKDSSKTGILRSGREMLIELKNSVFLLPFFSFLSFLPFLFSFLYIKIEESWFSGLTGCSASSFHWFPAKEILINQS